ncbi:YdeI/OmpD-associated family protein [Flavihumibacter sp. UBA7668]|uniref:YdeI/OmpD-associated family protein n=1 Tax=Flavihumibacter sp. UBA7668 TaxID=1946542 RepID=UPI0025C4059A|nr:YdeI/OmpD-associated family protein [Flavihumibacter sp. UBA7668]
MLVSWIARIEKFDQQGEKTGWSYLLISQKQAEKLNPGCKKSFRVKGRLDELEIKAMALLPMGGGDFILPLKAGIRKALGKQKGDSIRLKLEFDPQELKINGDLLECLQDEPAAREFFNSLTPGHQRYFTKWIEEAKTEQTRTRRVAQCVDALFKKWDYGQMIRAGKKQPFGP